MNKMPYSGDFKILIKEVEGLKSKPKKVTNASIKTLVAHYNTQLIKCNEILENKGSKKGDLFSPLLENLALNITSEEEVLIKIGLTSLIKRQNKVLGKVIKDRALELLEKRLKNLDGEVLKNEDGRTLGLKYKEVLSVLLTEFPEATTSVACLRWYVVHLRMEANDAGLPWPDLPQIRPRSN